MERSIFFQIPAWIIAVFIFLLVVLINWLGFSYRRKQSERKPEEVPENLGALESSLLGLMALILAFSFSMGASKLESRRSVVVDEANAIGTSIMRADLYPDSIRKLFLADFDKYIDSRIDYYKANFRDGPRIASLNAGSKISGRIWESVSKLSHNPDYLVSSQHMIPALNEMIDLVTKREALRQAKVPPLILGLLLLLTLVSSFISGYSYKAKRRNLIITICFALMTTFTLYIILELDRPRRGWISIDSAERKIEDLKSLVAERR